MPRPTDKQAVSLPIGDRILLLDNVADFSLLLYERDTVPYDTFLSFLKSGLNEGELCIFVYNSSSRKTHSEQSLRRYASEGALRMFSISRFTAKEFEALNDGLREAYREFPKNYSRLRLAVDFGTLPDLKIADRVLDCVRGISGKIEERVSLPESGKKVRFPLRAVIALESESLSDDFTKELLKTCKNLLVSTRNGHWASFPSFRRETVKVDDTTVVCQDTLDRFVKSHLETIISSLLLRNPLCGYDMIQSIYQQYHTFLSQATVYSLLHSLQRKNLLNVSTSEGTRAKVYSLTEQGGEFARREVDEFKRTQSFVLSLMG